MTPPFIAGQQARRDGQPITDNPHKPAPFSPDDYPGNHALWADGWRTQDWRIQRDKERA